MSDVAAAAAAMGVPEALVKRSAEARAKATGASVDEILAAWAGGAPAPTGTAAPVTEAAGEGEAGPATADAAPQPTASPDEPETQPVDAGAGRVAVAPDQQPRVAAATVASAPPVLVG